MKKNTKRILAIIGIVLICLLVLSFIISALVGSSQLFQVLLFSIWAIPLILWFGIALFGKLTGRSTIADLFQETDEERQLKEEALRASKGLPPEPENFTEEETTQAMLAYEETVQKKKGRK